MRAYLRSNAGYRLGDDWPLATKVKDEWRNDPRWVAHKTHTDRWDRALLELESGGRTTTVTPVPELSLSAGSAVDEGGNAEFTITADAAPQADLSVKFTVAQSGDYLDAPGAGGRTVTLSGGATTATLAVATDDDATDEPDGSVSVTLDAGTGYTVVAGQASDTVAVRDDDVPVSDPDPEVSIAAGNGVTEGTPASFTVTASPALSAPLTVTLTVGQSGDVAVAGQTGSREVVVPTGGSVTVEVATDDDGADEPDGSVSAAVDAGNGYTVAASLNDTATVAVADNDDAAGVPSLSVVDGQAHESEGRLPDIIRLSPPSKSDVSVWAVTRESNPVEAREGVDYKGWGWGFRVVFPPGATERRLAVRMVNDSHDEDAERFEVALSDPTGAAAIADGVGVMTIVNSDPMPAALQASERLKLWGALGYGTGEVTLEPGMGGSLEADLTWTMAAAGGRSDLLPPPREGSGPALALTSDALWARTSSEKTHELAASDSDVTRLRLGLEGSYRMALEGEGSLTPKLEIGARHDGGDAETGFGVEIGGGLAWSDPALGLALDLSGRTLLTHGSDDLEDRGFAASMVFDPDPATQRGPSLTLSQDWGGQANGGLDALFAPDPLDRRSGAGPATGTGRWTAETAWGFPAIGRRFVGSPHVEFGFATGGRDYTLGWRLTPAANANAPDLSFGVKATRSESDTAESEHTVGVEATLRW